MLILKTLKPELTTTILKFQFESLQHIGTSEQPPPVNNEHKFGVPRVVVHKFDCEQLLFVTQNKNLF